MNLSITKTANPKPKPDPNNLGFGTLFTDHMLNMDHDPEKGWHNARIEPYSPFSLDPSTMVLHYGQGIFEGLKAYRREDGGVQLFRPEANFARFNRSADLLCIPRIDANQAIEHLKELVRLEKEWVPGAPGTSLYIRPTIIAADPYLGVRVSHHYRYFVILSPVGAYYPQGFNPVRIWVTMNYVRAVRGGLGEAKTMANYAASLYAGQRAHDQGYTQVLWLDGVERRFIEEVGSMNIFFVLGGTLVTPALNGSILPGITRDSVIKLARRWGMPVEERAVSIDEIFDAQAAGKLDECFGTGTAAVISPVGELKYGERAITISGNQVGPMARKFYDAITGIQYGLAKDPFGWITRL
jgi:branched-chain amino acid aminotransferase